MIFPEFPAFTDLAQRGNLIPVWTSVPADLLTPVSAYLKLTGGSRKRATKRDFSFLLESVEGGETIARYTYLGAEPFLVLRFRMAEGKAARPPAKAGESFPGVVEITEKGRTRRLQGDLGQTVRSLLASLQPVAVEELPPFSAGAVGYLAYDLIRLHEPVPLPGRQPSRMPAAVLMFYSTLLVFDHVKHQIIIIRNVRRSQKTGKSDLRKAYGEAVAEIRRIEKKLQAPLSLPEEKKAPARRRAAAPVRSNLKKEEFCEMVRCAKEHIRAGDIFQVVLSQRLQTKIQSRPFDIYRALRRVNPAPYLFFLQLGGDCVLGSSPEMLVKISGEEVEYRPIAGTRPRGKTPEEDRRLERELLADEKERAEHVMLVDLGRNDLGRVCRFGTVRVTDLLFVERYSHVMHLVSSVRGKLRPEVDAWDTLWACFPAGTVSGAPKVRAMQIITELEPSRRGVYAGAVLYMDFSGNLNSAICIRTMTISGATSGTRGGGTAAIQVGAGIVADSEPEREYEETLNKGKALLRAIEMAQEEGGPGRRQGKR